MLEIMSLTKLYKVIDKRNHRKPPKQHYYRRMCGCAINNDIV